MNLWIAESISIFSLWKWVTFLTLICFSICAVNFGRTWGTGLMTCKCASVSILLCWWLDQRITCTRGQTRRPSFHQSTGNDARILNSLEPGTQKFYCPSLNGCPSLLWCHLCYLLYQIKSSSTFFSWIVNGHCVAQRLKFKITYI